MLMAGMWALYEYLRREVPDFEARSDFVYPQDQLSNLSVDLSRYAIEMQEGSYHSVRD